MPRTEAHLSGFYLFAVFGRRPTSRPPGRFLVIMPYALRRGHLGKLCTIVLFSFVTPWKMYSRSERCILEGETRGKRKEKESCSRGGREHGLRDVSRSRLLLSEVSATDLSDEWDTVIPLRTKCLDRRSDQNRLLSVDRC